MTAAREPAELIALKRAVAHFGDIRDGAVAKLSAAIGAPKSTVSTWLTRDRRCSHRYVLKIEHETGVPKEDLRPDLYKRESAA